MYHNYDQGNDLLNRCRQGIVVRHQTYPLDLSCKFYYTNHQKEIQAKARLQAEKTDYFYLKTLTELYVGDILIQYAAQ